MDRLLDYYLKTALAAGYALVSGRLRHAMLIPAAMGDFLHYEASSSAANG